MPSCQATIYRRWIHHINNLLLIFDLQEPQQSHGETQPGHNNVVPVVTRANNNPWLQQLEQSQGTPAHLSPRSTLYLTSWDENSTVPSGLFPPTLSVWVDMTAWLKAKAHVVSISPFGLWHVTSFCFCRLNFLSLCAVAKPTVTNRDKGGKWNSRFPGNICWTNYINPWNRCPH